MSMYFCAKCDNLMDDDYAPAAECPWDKCRNICPDCEDEIEAERENHE